MAAQVNLKISTTKKNGSKWYSTISAGGNKYYYRFTGGNTGNDNGAQHLIANGKAKSFDIRFIGKNKADFCFSDQFYSFLDHYSQLSAVRNANNTMTVTDQCSAGGLMLIGVYVHPAGSPGDLFLCDPRIINTLSR